MNNEKVETSLLKTFSPINGLKADNVQALANKTAVQTLNEGRFLFKQADEKHRTVYILEGDVELLVDGKVVRVIRGGSREAVNPLSPMFPRRESARAQTQVKYISIDSDLLDVMLTWDQTGSYEVSELRNGTVSEEDDWMTTLLRTEAFHKIPPANIQAIFMRMQQVHHRAGDLVIKQGEEGDFFYVITSGQCAVTRETPLNKEGIRLAQLGVGDTFGEEALISDAKRNATVTMITDGVLMRLGKDDFKTLLNEPMLDWVSFEEARQIIAEGGKWLDVRLPSEFDNYHQDGAINIPLYFIRLKLRTLDPKQKYIVCCDTGRRSSAGSFILNGRGFDTYVLEGGLTMSGATAEET
ncbi:MAG TPA: cyclic nucleotide-binding domain-containing protein [Gammaproteobacteria bacterium]|nr:cyclic nucleotide-binding domain-containing protein [Gammaproteobacteria bacterium]